MRARRFIEGQLRQVLQSKDLPWPVKASIERPREDGFGDMATNLALVLAKVAGKAPRQLAEEVRDELLPHEEVFADIEVAGPGFLNFFLQPGFWQATIEEVEAQGERYGESQHGGDGPVLIEYVSANPTGPLHIGHGRGAAVGDSLARILRFSGYAVTTEYYLNDAGRQMQLLGRSIWVRYQQEAGLEAALPEDCYQGAYIRDLAGELQDEHGSSLLEMPEDKAERICREYGLRRILQGIRKDLAEFRVDHEVWRPESELVQNGYVERTLESLAQSELAYESGGALWFRSSSFGDDKDRVLRKSDGELTYFASDIAYHAEKLSRGFSMLIDVWGADHHGYVPRMKAAVQALNRTPDVLRVILIQLVNLVRGGEYVSMSTRSGSFETLADVCREVGVDAARFIFLSRKSDSPLDFDLDLLKTQSMDNPVYYVQYAHARIRSMLRKATERGIELGPGSGEELSALNTREDLELLKALDGFPDVVASAAATLSPHHISYYLQELAGMLHRYYNKHQVLGTEPECQQARIRLMQGVAQILKNGLGLLGVNAPERM